MCLHVGKHTFRSFWSKRHSKNEDILSLNGTCSTEDLGQNWKTSEEGFRAAGASVAVPELSAQLTGGGARRGGKKEGLRARAEGAARGGSGQGLFAKSTETGLRGVWGVNSVKTAGGAALLQGKVRL